MKYTKDLFNYRNLPQNIKQLIKVDDMPTDSFRDKIYGLFSIAKKENIETLTTNQLAVGYYRQYTKKDNNDRKTPEDIESKINSIIKRETSYISKHPDYNLKRLKKVSNEKDTYTVE